jgi:hypothetical protein
MKLGRQNTGTRHRLPTLHCSPTHIASRGSVAPPKASRRFHTAVMAAPVRSARYLSSLRLFASLNCLASQNAKTMPQTMNRM